MVIIHPAGLYNKFYFKKEMVRMAVYKDNATGKWRVIYRFTDWTGKSRQTQKRGFQTKKEAVEWEREQMRISQKKLDMTFASFVDIYRKDRKPRLKENTWNTKEVTIQTKILPYFKDRKINEIEPGDVIEWQNQMMALKDKNGKKLSPVTLKTIHAQLSAIFNHAVRYYHLPNNPAAKAGSMGSEKSGEMEFWTKDEYLRFSEAVMDKPEAYYAFEMLYWTGLRCGELLALTREDFDLEKMTVSVNKSYQRIRGRDVVTPPKTAKSVRTIRMPDFLCEEMKDYLKMLYDPEPDERIFQISKSFLHHEMDRGSKAAGVKRIRVHGLRHSHISLLIEMGFTALAIADRVGHESIDITYRYAHLFPSKQDEMADMLSMQRKADMDMANSPATTVKRGDDSADKGTDHEVSGDNEKNVKEGGQNGEVIRQERAVAK
mgnify:CR=1 FL=1